MSAYIKEMTRDESIAIHAMTITLRGRLIMLRI